jgi:hypothetical protein
MTDTSQEAVAGRIADYMTQEISAIGMPKEAWIEIVLNAQNLFITQHDLVPQDIAEPGPCWEASDGFNPETVQRVPAFDSDGPNDHEVN